MKNLDSNSENTFDISFTKEELCSLWSIVSNSPTHPNFPDTKELNDFIEDLSRIIHATGVYPLPRKDLNS